MNYRNFADLNETILKRLYIIPRDIDLVVGIPRSGMIPANLLALYLNKPFTDLESFINGHIYKAGERQQFFDNSEIRNVLIVDDSLASGNALNKSKAKLVKHEQVYNIKYAVVYTIPGKEKSVDFYFDTVPLPRYFQWNILNHTILEKACFDIDGVLCVDPLPEQNDDGDKYREFILNAKPLFIPGAKIGSLVTSRLEKYRKETEIWLDKNNIKYDKLIMLDLPDMRARQKANCHGSFKASEYIKDKYMLFIESEKRQAVEINKITSKPVLCTADFSMIFEHQSIIYNVKSGQYLPFLRNILLKIRDKIRK